MLEQLEQFRKRLVRSAVAILVGMLVAFTFIERIVTFVLSPARSMLPAGSRLIYTEPIEAFSLYIDIALLAGVVLASPFVLYQFWLLIAPALYSHQKKFAIPFVALTSVGAVAGAAFSHYIVFPYMIAFFGTFSSADVAFLPRVETTFDLYVKMLLGMIAVFQIPTVVFFLAKMGLVTRAVPLAQHQVRDPDHLHHRGGRDAVERSVESDDLRRAHDRAVSLSIGIAWLVAPRRATEPASSTSEAVARPPLFRPLRAFPSEILRVPFPSGQHREKFCQPWSATITRCPGTNAANPHSARKCQIRTSR